LRERQKPHGEGGSKKSVLLKNFRELRPEFPGKG
jgi:hypothetical protein